MPGVKESLLGGHAVAAVGYADEEGLIDGCPPRCFKVRNSWSAAWGKAGYCFMPYEFMLALGSDLWVITSAEDGN